MFKLKQKQNFIKSPFTKIIPISILLAALAFPKVYSSSTVNTVQKQNSQNINISSQFKFVSEDKTLGIKEFELKSNKLKVLLAEKHSSPVVTVMIVYKVGSRNEAVGHTGSTHFLEHMMFKGTELHDPLKGTGLDDLLKKVGGINNATTSYDRTNYFEVVPANSLPTCLEIEADRMRNALLRESDRQSEMTVVRNELERGENYASSILDTQVFATAFREHPYHHPVIGWRSDVEGVPTEKLKQFYKDFYYPNNATLLIIGDFKTKEALELVLQNFGKIKPSQKAFPTIYTQEPKQEGERRFIVQKGDELPKLLLAYHIPNATNKDTYPLEVLASLLGDQRRQSSRLYKKLVDSGLASQAYAFNYSLKDPGLFTVYASVTSGSKLENIEKIIKTELAKLANENISEQELEKAKKAIWKKMKLEAADPANLAQQLAESEAVANWKWLIDFENKIKNVKAADIKEVAKKYFNNSNSTVGFYFPKDKNNKESIEKENIKIDSNTVNTNTDSKGILGIPDSLPESFPESPSTKIALLNNKSIQTKQTGFNNINNNEQNNQLKEESFKKRTKTKVLNNGLRVCVLPMPISGVVSISAKILSGDINSPKDKSLLAEFTAEMLNKGSKNISKDSLAESMESFGSNFDVESNAFWSEFDSDLVKEDFEDYLSIISDAIQNPLFNKEELDKLKKLKKAELEDAMVETSELAFNKFLTETYKNSCFYYQKPFAEQIKDLENISALDVQSFHKDYYSPKNMVISITGDIEPEIAFSYAEKYFGKWTGAEKVPINIPACCQETLKTSKTIESPLADKSNVDVIIGHPVSVNIKSKDFYAAQIANAVLGHDTISSKLAILREKHGLTYGISSYFSENAAAYAPWLIRFSVNPENQNKAMKLVQTIVSDYQRSGISKEELETEKNRLTGEYIVHRMRTPKQLADALSKYSILDLGPEFLDNYAKNIQSVSLKEANNAIQKYLYLDNSVTSIAGSIIKK